MSQFKQNNRGRNAFTLVEMIVVIVVVLTVSALTIAIAAPDNEARRLRETARQITGMMQSARAKAIETGRAAGVLIEPDAVNPFRAVSLQNVEVAPPYGGDFSDSKAVVVATSPTTAEVYVGLQPGVSNQDSAWLNLVKPQDQIRFNRQGHFYVIDNVINAAASDATMHAFEIRAVSSALPTYAFYPTPLAVPYEIVRQPETSAGTPLEIPEGVVIDLSLSGVGKGGFLPGLIPNPGAPPPYLAPQGTGTGPIALMFSPNGQLAIWMPNAPAGAYNTMSVPAETVFLMIGKNELIWGNGIVSPNGACNLSDPDSYWISIHHQTGLVTSSVNAPNTAGAAGIAAGRAKSIQTVTAGTN